ncbi:MAG: hypothetical protein ACFFD4_26525, partial [Candidatus Odinarchaeota archaeon]
MSNGLLGVLLYFPKSLASKFSNIATLILKSPKLSLFLSMIIAFTGFSFLIIYFRLLIVDSTSSVEYLVVGAILILTGVIIYLVSQLLRKRESKKEQDPTTMTLKKKIAEERFSDVFSYAVAEMNRADHERAITVF